MLIKYTGDYVKIYFIMKITFYFGGEILVLLRSLARIVLGTSIAYRSDRIGSDVIPASQDVVKHSFTVPASVALRSEHAPDKAPFVSHAGDLGTTLGGLVTVGCTFG